MTEQTKEEMDERFTLLVLSLHARLGRFPTEEEVTGFIFGSSEERKAIWNTNIKEQDHV